MIDRFINFRDFSSFQQVKLHRHVQQIQVNYINHERLLIFQQIHAMKIKLSVKRKHQTIAIRIVI